MAEAVQTAEAPPQGGDRADTGAPEERFPDGAELSRRRGGGPNQCVHGCVRVEHEENDGKAQEEILAIYLQNHFSAKFIAISRLSQVYKERLTTKEAMVRLKVEGVHIGRPREVRSKKAKFGKLILYIEFVFFEKI